jgi:integrase
MARNIKDTSLETRAARLRLAVRKQPYWRAIAKAGHVGYRRSVSGGAWLVRAFIGRSAACRSGYLEARLGAADDVLDADGISALSFWQAQDKARTWLAEQARIAAGVASKATAPLTVRQACESYIEFLRAERKTAVDTQSRLAKHIYPSIGKRPVYLLTSGEIEKVKRAMVRRDPDDPDTERRSKDSGNRCMSMLRGALNRAFQSGLVPSDAAWRRVKPFHDVGRARQVHLDIEQSRRLINCCQGAFRNLVTAALITGARAPGELAGLRVHDFHADLATLSVDGKTGRRDIVLTQEAMRFFQAIAAGREPDALLLPRDDGTAWGKNHHVRPMKEAVARAKLPAETTIYCLRHSHASQALLRGMNLKLLAENMGTSIRMLETNYAKFLAASRRELIEASAPKLGLEPSNVVAIGTAKQ